MHAEATWRCSILRGLAASEICLLQLNAAAHGDAMLQTRIQNRGANEVCIICADRLRHRLRS